MLCDVEAAVVLPVLDTFERDVTVDSEINVFNRYANLRVNLNLLPAIKCLAVVETTVCFRGTMLVL